MAGLRCVELMLAFFVQAIISSCMPDVISAIGGSLIILGVIILAFQGSLVKYMTLMVKWTKEYQRQSVSNPVNQYTQLLTN